MFWVKDLMCSFFNWKFFVNKIVCCENFVVQTSFLHSFWYEFSCLPLEILSIIVTVFTLPNLTFGFACSYFHCVCMAGTYSFVKSLFQHPMTPFVYTEQSFQPMLPADCSHISIMALSATYYNNLILKTTCLLSLWLHCLTQWLTRNRPLKVGVLVVTLAECICECSV